MKFNISISEFINNISEYEVKFNKDFFLYDVSSLNQPKSNSLMFINKGSDLRNMRNVKECLLIVDKSLSVNIPNQEYHAIITSMNPRLDYAIICEKLVNTYKYKKSFKEVQHSVYVENSSNIHSSVILEPNVFIDSDVNIGENTVIQSGVKIYSNVSIGSNCVIGANTTIGLYGFGVEIDNQGVSHRIPQLGGVIIGNGVNISSLCNIHAGTIDPTIIEDFVQLDSMVHIGHNCNIGESTLITACTEISGSVKLGNKCYIGPNSSLMNKITLGNNVVVGLGAVVTKSFDSDSVIAGNPADHTRNLKRKKEILSKLIKERDLNNEK